MSKYFSPWNIDQTLLLEPTVLDFVPKAHVSRFIVELVRESLDRMRSRAHVSGLGQPPFDWQMMVALRLHSYASRLYSSRRIARACRERNDFAMIFARDPPDFRTISDFRKRIEGAWRVVPAGFKVVRDGRGARAPPRRAGSHEDQGERVKTQADDL